MMMLMMLMMIVHKTNNIIVSAEAILSAENIGKPLGGLGSAANPAGKLTALPRPPGGGEVVADPLEPHARSRPSV